MNQTPCQAGNPDDWFIEKDGRQYKDDEPLTVEEAADAIEQAFPDGEFTKAEALRALERAADEKRRVALIRRRKAKEACYECPFRHECLSLALGDKTGATDVEYGIRGGYYPEELQEIVRVRDSRRSAVD